MEKVRVIISSDGSNEFVIFTLSFDDDASDFVRPGCKITTDQIIEWDEPRYFPMESVLHNIG